MVETILSVDVGGSKYMVGYVTPAGDILCSSRHEWVGRTPDAIVEQLAAACERLRAEHPDLAACEVAGGMTIPGFAEPVRGVWVDSDFLDVHDLPVCDLLRDRLGLRFYGDNDCNACVLAEAYFGAVRGADDFLYMTVSSGIGGGVYLGGQLFYGAHAQSGEIGLTISCPGGRASLSGNQLGPLEMYGCTSGMARTLVEMGGPLEVDGLVPGGREIAGLAEKGNEAAVATIELEGRFLGRAIACATALLGCDDVVIGGGISLMFDSYRDALEAELARVRPDAHVRVSATTLGYEGALLGAAACGLRGWRGFEDACGIESVEAQDAGATGQTPADGGTLFSVDLAGGHVTSTLVAARHVLLDATALGAYLVADGIDDPGTTLDGLFAQVADISALDDDAAARLGDALGRAVAFACMVLDPGEIRLTGALATAPAAMRDALAAAIQRDTYWEQGRVPYRVRWM